MYQIIKIDKLIFIPFLLYLLFPAKLLATDPKPKVLKNQSTSDHLQLLTSAQVGVLVDYWYRDNKGENIPDFPRDLTNRIAKHFGKVSYEPRTVWFSSSVKAKIFFNEQEVQSDLVCRRHSSSEKEIGSKLVNWRWRKFTCTVPGFFYVSEPTSLSDICYQWVYLRPMPCDISFLRNPKLYPRELTVTYRHKSLKVSAQWDWNFFGLLIASKLETSKIWLNAELLPTGRSYGIYSDEDREGQSISSNLLGKKIGDSFTRNSARVASSVFTNNIKFSNPLEKVSD